MCIAIIGSRTLSIPDLGIYLPKDTTEIISGGAKGVTPPRGNTLWRTICP